MKAKRQKKSIPSQAIQYTVRKVPAHIDQAIKRLAKSKRVSVNQLLLEYLQSLGASSVSEAEPKYRDLDSLAGSWVEDKKFDAALKEQSKIDKSLWK